MKKGRTAAVAALAVLVIVLVIIIGARAACTPADMHQSISAENTQPPQTEQATPEQVVPVATPEPTPEPTPAPTPEPTPPPPDIDINEWQYRLVNTENLLESDYAPELTLLEGSQYFDSRAVDALNSFVAGAREAGLTVILSSSYRSYSVQQYLFNNKVYQTGSEEAAAKIVAIPGSSEHQLGLAVDIVDGYYQYMNESLADTELSKWMYEHCWEYGFILRYPEDKQDITKIMFEPWHFRYVGVEAAKYIMENGLCLEEFVAIYK